ncbi:MAG: T9SS type A sorting domain-containing protein [Bacteroidetes bacterium]|nr:T9SS type A sorting domain-containing protein [Bacteroidota bacterium]
MRFTVSGVFLLLFSFAIRAQLCLNTSVNRGLLYEPLETISTDFNLDGKADIAIIMSSGIIQILPGNGDNTFGAALNISAGPSPSSLKTGDFNADGKPDLALANTGTNYVSVLLGLGTGSFAPATTYTLNSNVYALTCNDFNGDGNPDLAVTSATNVSIFSGLGTGSFSAPVTYSVNVNANIIESADLNNDGKLDFILANNAFNSPYVYVAMALSAGGYSASVATPVCNSPTAIICNDFTDDGIKDVVVTNLSCSYRSILIGTGTGSFSNTLLNDCTQGESAALSADFNNDGKQDLAVTNSTNGSVGILSGTGDVNAYYIFDASYYTTGLGPQSIASSDFNGDGLIDLIVGNRDSKTLSILNGNGNGKFAASKLIVTSANPSFATVADINNDSYSDIIVGYVNSSSARVLLNTGTVQEFELWNPANFGTVLTTIKSADINHDGNIDLVGVNGYTNTISVVLGSGNGNFGSPTTYTLSGSPRDIAIADFNNDSYPDLAITQSTNTLSIMLGTAGGSLLPAISYSVSSPHTGIVTSDYNNDGNLDLVTTSYSSNSYFVSLGVGNGNFAPEVSYNATGAYPLQIAAIATKDFNNDGINDLVLTQTNISTSAADYAIFIATGTGSFNFSSFSSIGSNPNSIVCADYDGDNKQDLAIVSTDYSSGGSFTYNNISFFLGYGNGTFGSEIDYPVGLDPVMVVNADFNNDSKTDLISINFRSDNLSLIMNGPPIEIVSSNTICAGTNTPLTAYGTSTYSWSTGSNAAVIHVSPSVNTTYTVTGTATSGCIGTAVKTISVAPLPAVSATSGSICTGSSYTITPGGAHTYTFSSGSAIVSPVSTSNYTVFGMDTITMCTGNAISTITVDQTCQDVWPGDANSDGVANNLDVLELGLHYSQTGTPRAVTSNSWQPWFSSNWAGTISNGKNINHSDCNGDGTINDADTLAIFTNYGFTHAFRSSETTSVNPQLSIIPDQASVLKGNWGSASIYLGDAGNPMVNINGAAFTVTFNKTLIEPTNIYLEYQPSFLDASQNLHFRKLDFLNEKIFTATTHTVSNNANGFGKIATLYYQIKSNLGSDQVLTVGLSQAYRSNASGSITPLSSGTGTLMALANTVGLTEHLFTDIVSISPNPASDVITVSAKSDLQKIELTTVTGQLVLSETSSDNNHILHLESYSAGVYFISIYQQNRIIKREKIIITK